MKQLLMGGKDLATYLPNGAFQPYIKNFIKYELFNTKHLNSDKTGLDTPYASATERINFPFT